jgi:hypothetical protein
MTLASRAPASAAPTAATGSVIVSTAAARAALRTLLALTCTLATPACALEVVATFAGTVVSVTDSDAYLPDDVVLSAAVTGRFQYQTTGTTVSFPFNDYAEYTFADGGMSIRVTVGSSSWEVTTPTAATPHLELTNDSATLRDGFWLTASTPVAFPADLGSSRASIVMKDESVPYQMVGDLDLPQSAADLVFTSATVRQGLVRSDDGPEHWQFMFNLSMLSFEPSTLEPATWSAVKRLFE